MTTLQLPQILQLTYGTNAKSDQKQRYTNACNTDNRPQSTYIFMFLSA